jgi:hypothetical protein
MKFDHVSVQPVVNLRSCYYSGRSECGHMMLGVMLLILLLTANGDSK